MIVERLNNVDTTVDTTMERVARKVYLIMDASYEERGERLLSVRHTLVKRVVACVW